MRGEPFERRIAIKHYLFSFLPLIVKGMGFDDKLSANLMSGMHPDYALSHVADAI